MIDVFRNAHSLEVERAVLGVILDGRYSDSWGRFADACGGPAAFFSRNHRLVAMVMARLAMEGREIDVLTVQEAASQITFHDAMKALKNLDEDKDAQVDPSGEEAYQDSLLAGLGGRGAISQIAGDFAPPSGFDGNIAKMAEYHRQRALICSLSQSLDKAIGVGGTTKAKAIADAAINNLSTLMGNGQGAQSIAECAAEVLIEHDRAALSGEVRAAKWGIEPLDIACPLDLGHVTIVAARPGCGKTSMMLQVAEATTKYLGPESVGLVTLEMPGKALSRIMIGRQIGVGRNAIRGGWMTEEQRAKFEMAVKYWRENDIPIKDHGERCNVDDVCAWVRSRHRRSQGKLALVGIDYLQLVNGTNPKHNENDKISEVSRKIKLLSNHLNIAILLLCQINRESVKDKRDPDLIDLRGSGSIEQDADAVVFLYGKDEETGVAQITAKVAKNRAGARSSTGLEFLRAYGQSFREIGKREPNTKMFSEPKASEDVLNGL